MNEPEGEPRARVKPDLLTRVVTVNIGLEEFYDSLREQKAEVIHVAWRPPAAGDADSIELLDNLL